MARTYSEWGKQKWNQTIYKPEDIALFTHLEHIKIGKYNFDDNKLAELFHTNGPEDVSLLKQVFQEEYPITRTYDNLPRVPSKPEQKDKIIESITTYFNYLRSKIIDKKHQSGDSVSLRELIDELQKIKTLKEHFEETKDTFPYHMFKDYLNNKDLINLKGDIQTQVRALQQKKVQDERIRNLLRQFAMTYIKNKNKNKFTVRDPGLGEKEFDTFLEGQGELPIALLQMIDSLRGHIILDGSDNSKDYEELRRFVNEMKSGLTGIRSGINEDPINGGGIKEELQDVKQEYEGVLKDVIRRYNVLVEKYKAKTTESLGYLTASKDCTSKLAEATNKAQIAAAELETATRTLAEKVEEKAALQVELNKEKEKPKITEEEKAATAATIEGLEAQIAAKDQERKDAVEAAEAATAAAVFAVKEEEATKNVTELAAVAATLAASQAGSQAALDAAVKAKDAEIERIKAEKNAEIAEKKAEAEAAEAAREAAAGLAEREKELAEEVFGARINAAIAEAHEEAATKASGDINTLRATLEQQLRDSAAAAAAAAEARRVEEARIREEADTQRRKNIEKTERNAETRRVGELKSAQTIIQDVEAERDRELAAAEARRVREAAAEAAERQREREALERQIAALTTAASGSEEAKQAAIQSALEQQRETVEAALAANKSAIESQERIAQAAIAAAAAAAARLEEELAALAAKPNTELRAAEAEHRAAEDALRTELAAAKAAKNAAEATVTSTNTAKDAVEKEIRKELEECNTQKAALTASAATAAEAAARAAGEAAGRLAALEEEKAALRSSSSGERQGLEARIAAAEADARTAREAATEADRKAVLAKREEAAAKLELAGKNSQIATLSAQKEASDEAAAAARATIQAQEARFTADLAALTEANAAAAAAKEEAQAAALAAEQANLARVSQERNTARGQLATATGERNAATRDKTAADVARAHAQAAAQQAQAAQQAAERLTAQAQEKAASDVAAAQRQVAEANANVLRANGLTAVEREAKEIAEAALLALQNRIKDQERLQRPVRSAPSIPTVVQPPVVKSEHSDAEQLLDAFLNMTDLSNKKYTRIIEDYSNDTNNFKLKYQYDMILALLTGLTDIVLFNTRLEFPKISEELNKLKGELTKQRLMDGTFVSQEAYKNKFPSLKLTTKNTNETKNVNLIKSHIDTIVETILSNSSLTEKTRLLKIFKDQKNIRTNPRFSGGGAQDTLLEYCNKVANDSLNTFLSEEPLPFFSLIEDFEKASKMDVLKSTNEEYILKLFIQRHLEEHFETKEMKEFYFHAKELFGKQDCSEYAKMFFVLNEIINVIRDSKEDIDTVRIKSKEYNSSFDYLEFMLQGYEYDFYNVAKKKFVLDENDSKQMNLTFKDTIFICLNKNGKKTYDFNKNLTLKRNDFDYKEDICYINSQMVYLFFILSTHFYLQSENMIDNDEYKALENNLEKTVRKLKRTKNKEKRSIEKIFKERKEFKLDG